MTSWTWEMKFTVKSWPIHTRSPDLKSWLRQLSEFGVELFQTSKKIHFGCMTSPGTFKTRKIIWIWGSTRKTRKKMQRLGFGVAHLSAWLSHSPLYTPVDCPPSGSTHPLWLAASCTRCRRSSEGDRRNPALSAPPDSAGCPADTPHTSSRTSCTDEQGYVNEVD